MTRETREAEAWAALGRAMEADRQRQGMTRAALVDRVKSAGGDITTRTIASREKGVTPKSGGKPASVELIARALGWEFGWADRILAGEDPASVLAPAAPATAGADLLDELPRIYQFSRAVVAAGGNPAARDRFDEALEDLVASLPARASYALAAYRPHAEGQGIPSDDAARIDRAAAEEG